MPAQLPPLQDNPVYQELKQILIEQQAQGGRLPSDQDLHATGPSPVTGNLITVSEAAEALHLSRQRVQVLARTGRLVGARKIGRDWLIPSPVVVNPPIQTKLGRRP